MRKTRGGLLSSYWQKFTEPCDLRTGRPRSRSIVGCRSLRLWRRFDRWSNFIFIAQLLRRSARGLSPFTSPPETTGVRSSQTAIVPRTVQAGYNA
jgi:hypothetical protein